MISAVHHCCVTVSDIDRSLTFYRGILGLQLLFTGESSDDAKGVRIKNAMLQAGDDKIELMQYVCPKGRPYDLQAHDVGSTHIAFRVTDIDRVYLELKRKCVRFMTSPNEYRKGPVTSWWCKFFDPDGVILELIEEK
jgi:catechol 2,3-dioxygenase-like lactoylglutathione lyase family enzyme